MVPFALYVHLPWCRHVCPYCDFNVYAAAAPPDVAYAGLLAAELAGHAAHAPWADRSVRSVYLGGGTCAAWPASSAARDRKSTRLNSSHLVISYAVFCLKK